MHALRQLRRTVALILPLVVVAAAHSDIFRVDSAAAPGGSGGTWPLAFSTLEAALSSPLVGPDDELWVAAGTYVPTARSVPTDPRSARFFIGPSLNGIRIYGGFLGLAPGGSETQLSQRNPEVNRTRLSGDILGNDGPGPFQDYGDNCYNILYMQEIGSQTLLDGFEVASGSFEGGVVLPLGGGGLYLQDAAPRIVRCTFIACQADGVGGAVQAHMNSSSTFVNCAFLGNRCSVKGGAVRLMFSSHALFMNCTFSGNGLFSGGSEGAGAISVGENSEPLIINSSFSQNSAVASSAGGGAMWFEQTTVTNPVSSAIRNCIFADNLPQQIVIEQDIQQPISYPTISYSDIEGPFPPFAINGGGNISADPLFRDADGPDNVLGTLDDDLRLLPASPCIDEARNSDLPPDFGDLNGNQIFSEPTPRDLKLKRRIIHFTVDMGAHEFGCATDLNDDCLTNGMDLAALLAAWTAELVYGPCPPYWAEDLNEDCRVNGLDLAILLAGWGPCSDCSSSESGAGGGAAQDSGTSGGAAQVTLEWALQATEAELLEWYYSLSIPDGGSQ